MEEKTNSQEIDLLELLARFYGYLRENWIITILLPLSGAILGLIFYLSAPPKFESKMMIVTDILTEAECDFLLLELEQADSVQVLLGIQSHEKIKLSHQIKKDPQSKTVHIEIEVKVRNKELLKVVENRMITFLEESEQSRKRKADSKEYLHQMIGEIDKELASLEGVKGEFDNKTKATFLNPSDLFMASLNLQERKINYQIQLREIKAFRLVQGLTMMINNAKLPATLLILIGLIGGTFMLMITLFVKFFLAYYKRYQQTQPV